MKPLLIHLKKDGKSFIVPMKKAIFLTFKNFNLSSSVEMPIYSFTQTHNFTNLCASLFLNLIRSYAKKK